MLPYTACPRAAGAFNTSAMQRTTNPNPTHRLTISPLLRIRPGSASPRQRHTVRNETGRFYNAPLSWLKLKKNEDRFERTNAGVAAGQRTAKEKICLATPTPNDKPTLDYTATPCT